MSDQATPTHFIDNEAHLVVMMEVLERVPRHTPSLYIDIEGVNLSRHGSISLITILVQPQSSIYLVDVHRLQARAFNTATPTGTTLRSILEDAAITKIFFDVRNDSDALHAHYGIKLRGIEDIQLMENAGRPEHRQRLVSGLGRCIEQEAPLPPRVKDAWKQVKSQGGRLFSPELGGSYEVFNERPLREDIRLYCVVDVKFLPLLRDVYWARLSDAWKLRVRCATEERVRASQSLGYDPFAKSKTLSPFGSGK